MPFGGCVWDAPSCLQNVEKLVNRYQDCKSLFWDKLLLRSATIDHVVDELELLSPKADLMVRKELLLLLNDYIAQGAPESSIIRQKHKKIFPINSSSSECKYDLQSYSRRFWYLADRTICERALTEKYSSLNLLWRKSGRYRRLSRLWILKNTCCQMPLWKQKQKGIQY